jgi:hypothetical protein
VLLVCSVAAFGIFVKITAERRRYRRQLARSVAAPSQHPSSDEKRPECHEVWLSSPSGDPEWKNILVGLRVCLLDNDQLN